MALMEIVTWPDPILDEPGDPVTDFGDWLKTLVRQRAGRTLAPDRSSNGNGTRTSFPLIIEGFSVS